MKFLIDNALSPIISIGLKKNGYDSIHVRDIGMGTADDKTIFKYAEKEERTIISSDTDFGTLLALWNKNKPSFILFRRENNIKPNQLLEILLNNLEYLNKDIDEGSIIVIGDSKIRIKSLPIIK